MSDEGNWAVPSLSPAYSVKEVTFIPSLISQLLWQFLSTCLWGISAHFQSKTKQQQTKELFLRDSPTMEEDCTCSLVPLFHTEPHLTTSAAGDTPSALSTCRLVHFHYCIVVCGRGRDLDPVSPSVCTLSPFCLVLKSFSWANPCSLGPWAFSQRFKSGLGPDHATYSMSIISDCFPKHQGTQLPPPSFPLSPSNLKGKQMPFLLVYETRTH